jgi:hypothetical protein
LISPKQEIEIKDIAGIASYTKIIECFIHFWWQTRSYVLEGVDANYSKSMLLNQNFITDSGCNPIPIK